MATIPNAEAKAKLAALVREGAASGEAYVISVNGLPMAGPRPFSPVPTPGRYKEDIRFTDDAFAPLTDEEAADSRRRS